MIRIFIFPVIVLILISCAPLDKIYSHDFSSGFYKLKSPGSEPENVYVDLREEQISVYELSGKRSVKADNPVSSVNISSVKSGDALYNSTLYKTSFDLDLSTVPVKFRIGQGDVPSQLNATVNGAIYAGFRHDFFKMITRQSALDESTSFIRQTGFDFGLFAGLGTTFVNPTVTMNGINQEYDGIVFQKGIAGFFNFENISVGIGLGFDNLLDKNKNIWIYNQKPWIGIVLGVANF